MINQCEKGSCTYTEGGCNVHLHLQSLQQVHLLPLADGCEGDFEAGRTTIAEHILCVRSPRSDTLVLMILRYLREFGKYLLDSVVTEGRVQDLALGTYERSCRFIRFPLGALLLKEVVNHSVCGFFQRRKALRESCNAPGRNVVSSKPVVTV